MDIYEVLGFLYAETEGDDIGIFPPHNLIIMSQIVLGQKTIIDADPLRWSRFTQG